MQQNNEVVKKPKSKMINDNSLQKEQKSLKLLHSRQEISVSPIPSPQILQQYAQIDPSLPDRIMKMAEKDLQSKHYVNYLGWFSAFALSFTLISGSIYLLANDKSITGLITLASSSVLLILQLFFAKKAKRDKK